MLPISPACSKSHRAANRVRPHSVELGSGGAATSFREPHSRQGWYKSHKVLGQGRGDRLFGWIGFHIRYAPNRRKAPTLGGQSASLKPSRRLLESTTANCSAYALEQASIHQSTAREDASVRIFEDQTPVAQALAKVFANSVARVVLLFICMNLEYIEGASLMMSFSGCSCAGMRWHAWPKFA